MFEFELNSLRSFDTYDVGRLLWPSDLKDDEGRGFEYRCRQGFFLKKSELERSSSCGICTLYKCELYIVSTVSSVYVADGPRIRIKAFLKDAEAAFYLSVSQDSNKSRDQESGNCGGHVGDAHQDTCFMIKRWFLAQFYNKRANIGLIGFSHHVPVR